MAIKEDDVIKNKAALIDEMGSALATLNDFINEAIEKTADGNPATLLSSMIGMSHQVGFITAAFNQYIIFERGMNDGEKKIGFGSMFQKAKDD